MPKKDMSLARSNAEQQFDRARRVADEKAMQDTEAQIQRNKTASLREQRLTKQAVDEAVAAEEKAKKKSPKTRAKR